MRHPKIIIGGLALAAVDAAGGITAASAGGSPASMTPGARPGTAATVRTARATVGGNSETILVNAAGQVTGQGVQNLFVATPGLAPVTASSAPGGTLPAAPSANGYGY